MDTEWKILTRGDAVAQFPLLYATLNPQGAIVINRSTHERLGGPEKYIVMFDPLKHRLGLKAASPDDPNAYPARKWGTSGAKVIRAHRMLKEFGVKPPDTLEFPEVRIVEDVLVLDLQSARTSTRAHSQCRYERVPQQEPQPEPVRRQSPFPWVKFK